MEKRGVAKVMGLKDGRVQRCKVQYHHGAGEQLRALPATPTTKEKEKEKEEEKEKEKARGTRNHHRVSPSVPATPTTMLDVTVTSLCIDTQTIRGWGSLENGRTTAWASPGGHAWSSTADAETKWDTNRWWQQERAALQIRRFQGTPEDKSMKPAATQQQAEGANHLCKVQNLPEHETGDATQLKHLSQRRHRIQEIRWSARVIQRKEADPHVRIDSALYITEHWEWTVNNW
jgi:hypothetical protein